MFIQDEDVIGYENVGRENETVCIKCISDEEAEAVAVETDIVTTDIANDSDGYYFCDRCKKNFLSE